MGAGPCTAGAIRPPPGDARLAPGEPGPGENTPGPPGGGSKDGWVLRNCADAVPGKAAARISASAHVARHRPLDCDPDILIHGGFRRKSRRFQAGTWFVTVLALW
jgi:hypothetical protein